MLYPRRFWLPAATQNGEQRKGSLVMGDKGGKKDKDKVNKQKVNKKAQEEKKKQDKRPKRTP